MVRASAGEALAIDGPPARLLQSAKGVDGYWFSSGLRFRGPPALPGFPREAVPAVFPYGLGSPGAGIRDAPEGDVDREMAMKVLSALVNNFFGKLEEPKNIPLILPLMSLLFGQIAKIIRECKDFYFANNQEAQYNELERISAANSALREENNKRISTLQDKDRTISVLQSQVKALSIDLSKDAKEAQRPLNDVISKLQSQVSSLQEELEVEREKNSELNRLREFVFAIQSGADIEKAKTSLKDLINGKKIFVFGGHVNWRNKMKSVHPSLSLLDGHQTSFDERLLLDADMVFLNTANMSHTVYYKVMDVLRKNKIPFDYIGRSWNIELLEQEMAEKLQGY